MKKAIVLVVLIVLMILSFFVSGLFFANSGMVDEGGEFNETRAKEIVTELDKIPLINFDLDFEEEFCTQNSEC